MNQYLGVHASDPHCTSLAVVGDKTGLASHSPTETQHQRKLNLIGSFLGVIINSCMLKLSLNSCSVYEGFFWGFLGLNFSTDNFFFVG